MVRDVSGSPAGIVAVARDIAEQKHLMEDIQLYIRESIRAQEEEHKRSAQELHDDNIQELLLVTHRLHDVGAGTYDQLPEQPKDKHGSQQPLI